MVLRRIESALARLEAAARQTTRLPVGEPSTTSTPELAKLETSNTRLREAIALSLRQIDGLVARHEAGQQR